MHLHPFRSVVSFFLLCPILSASCTPSAHSKVPWSSNFWKILRSWISHPHMKTRNVSYLYILHPFFSVSFTSVFTSRLIHFLSPFFPTGCCTCPFALHSLYRSRAPPHTTSIVSLSIQFAWFFIGFLFVPPGPFSFTLRYRPRVICHHLLSPCRNVCAFCRRYRNWRF